MVYGDSNDKHSLCYYHNFDKFYAFLYVNPMDDYTFSAEVSFKLKNYSLILSDNDTEDTWNIELEPNQEILKFMKKVKSNKNSSWKNSATFKFI